MGLSEISKNIFSQISSRTFIGNFCKLPSCALASAMDEDISMVAGESEELFNESENCRYSNLVKVEAYQVVM